MVSLVTRDATSGHMTGNLSDCLGRKYQASHYCEYNKPLSAPGQHHNFIVKPGLVKLSSI